MNQIKTWTVLQLLQTTTEYLQQKGVENARLNAEQMLARVLQKSRVDLYLAFEQPVAKAELATYRDMVRRRSQREPLQYILGDTEFMGLPFSVGPEVLIPRPETEVLVEEVLQLKETNGSTSPLIVDVGTGSGCIAISLAHYWPDAQVVGVDISQKALQVATQNAQLNNVQERISFFQHDILQTWPSTLPSKIQILVSNPPYIGKTEMDGLQPEVGIFEPQIALTDLADGLTFYRRLFELVAMDGAPRIDYLILEMSGSQPQKILGLAETYNFKNLHVQEDLTGIPRVLKVKV